ncbi:hypothetical protein GCM10009069_29860 [Algimonas arctica]|uniref:DUF4440 domain-containing protein n=1 Tax=Algimonas arctica TaxID=1479486 RepID=A0A8J3CTS9_9PROT|nr:DUF2231 domain-containing protein [Algimonas arctica]GHB05485.1 hypothetical protein GCM10009069_29860 [Algimonas arctica]
MGGFLEPNIHPVLVHFAYALSLSSLAVYVLGRLLPNGPRKDSTQSAGDWMLAFGAVAIVATIAAGFYAYYTVAHDGPSHAAMTTHRNWAVPSGTAIILLAIWRLMKRARPPSGIFLALLAAAALSLSVTAWWGGNIVFKYGIGVQSLPTVTSDGHDHDHGNVLASPRADAPGSESMSNGHDNADGHHDADAASINVPPALNGSPAAVADQFGQALRAQDAAGLKTLFAPGAIIAEGGGAERSFAEYASHHMKSDMAYTASITTQTIKRDVLESADMATVITQSEMVGNYRGKNVHNAMMETMTLRREGKDWKIVHIHWSSTPLKGGDASMPKPEPETPVSAPEVHDNSDGHHDHDHDADGGR